MDFEQIPGQLHVPGSYTEIKDVPAPGRLTGMPVRPLIVGPTAKKELAGQLFRNVSPGHVEGLFGAGSVIAQAVRTFSAEQPMLSVDVVTVTTPDGAKPATGTLAFSGAPQRAGTAAILVGGQRVSWPVATNDTPQNIAAQLLTAINASTLTQNTGVTAALGKDGTSVVFTAGEGGAVTNDIDLRLSSALSDQVPGMVVTVTPMSEGTGTPDVTPAVMALGEIWYTDVVLLVNDQAAVSAFVQEAKRRGNAMVAKDMRVCVGLRASMGQALAFQQNFGTSEELVLFAWENPRASSWQMAASLGAVMAQSLNTDPARQLRGLPLTTLTGLGPEHGDDFTFNQRNLMLGTGCTTVTVSEDGTIALERVVTTRVTMPETGTASGVWDVMIPAIGARVRFEWNSFAEANYARAKLADDGSPLANVDGVVTPKTLKASWIGQCKLYEQQGWIDDVATTGPQAVFERDATDRNRVNSSLPILPMGSLMVLANILTLEV
ncbi:MULTISPECIES: phage tail protein [unclassified Saccharibacter]|uniref:phage tail protein n=1 Tax=unclassified Saccharibacter TaxID=2648722 RepID=UPI0013233DA2|nr:MULTISPECIES: phage tail protein [unclassified Saccharibacter]MXV35840.1 phage tail protein [Saccharibacter sp. EH611]MXV57961.1 phage tail protein [Saccharibacter sp. EH70]MXV66356.1 phage tail protein [Saccharibacter sp. EH60]